VDSAGSIDIDRSREQIGGSSRCPPLTEEETKPLSMANDTALVTHVSTGGMASVHGRPLSRVLMFEIRGALTP
jgi:hypothetical protein